MSVDDILDVFFEMVQDIVEGITLPTGKDMIPSFIFALIITLVSLVSNIAGQFTIVDWRGGAIATATLGILVFIERRGVNEVSRMYRVAESRIKDAAKRATRPGTVREAKRGKNPGDPDDDAD